jgi:ketosteroid isomerase-like protein
MKHSSVIRTAVTVSLILSSLGLACAQRVDAQIIESALRKLDAQWSNAAGAKDLEKTVSYYAAAANVMPPNGPAATTKEAISAMWKELLTSAGASISWTATKVEVANSGDIAYTTGTYQLTMNDASGKAVPDHGKYLEVWKKQADGNWKVVADIWNSDLSVPTVVDKK